MANLQKYLSSSMLKHTVFLCLSFYVCWRNVAGVVGLDPGTNVPSVAKTTFAALVSAFMTSSLTNSNITMETLITYLSDLNITSYADITDMFEGTSFNVYLIPFIVSCVTMLVANNILNYKRSCSTPPKRVDYIAQSDEPDLNLDVPVNVAPLVNNTNPIIDEVYGVSGLFKALTWNTTDAIDTNIGTLSFPDIYTHPIVKRLFSAYKFARFDIECTVNIVGNPSATGILYMVYIPRRNNTYLLTQVGIPVPAGFSNRQVASVNLHQRIDASVSKTTVMTIPFTYCREYLSSKHVTDLTGSQPNWGSIAFTVYSPYLPPVGSPTSVTFDVYFRLTNIHVMQVTPLLAQSQPQEILDTIRNSNLPSNVTDDSHILDDRVARRHIRSTPSVARQTPDPSRTPTETKASWYTRLANFVMPYLSPAGALVVGAVRAVGGFDKPSDPRNPTTMSTTPFQKLNSAKTVLDVEVLSHNPTQIVSLDEVAADMMHMISDEMSFANFYNRPYFYAHTVLNNTSAKNSRFLEIPVNPCIVNLSIPNFVTSKNASLQPLFKNCVYWRGTMKYRISWPVCMFKTGRILANIQYGVLPSDIPNTIAPGLMDPRTTDSVIFDISSPEGFVDIIVPYKAIQSVSRTAYFNYTSLEGSYNWQNYTESFPAVVSFYLVSPIIVNSTVSSTTNFYIEMFMGEDMCFFNYSKSAFSMQAEPALKSVETSTVTLLNNKALITSIKDLLMIPVLYTTINIMNNAGSPFIDPLTSENLPIMLPINVGFIQTSSVWDWCIANYCSYIGSLRLVVRYYGSKILYIRYVLPNNATVPNTNAPYLTPLAADYPRYARTYTSIDRSQPKIHESMLFPACSYKNIPTALPGMTTPAVGHTNIKAVVSPLHPEKIIEIPDTSGSDIFNTVVPLTNTSLVGTTYNPYLDPKMPMLIIESLSKFDASDRIEVFLMAGDDFRFFHYNGNGSSVILPAYIENAVGTLPDFLYLAPDASPPVFNGVSV
jgi:hypothetical protein